MVGRGVRGEGVREWVCRVKGRKKERMKEREK
jgi:hypothetical protein